MNISHAMQDLWKSIQRIKEYILQDIEAKKFSSSMTHLK